MELVNIWYLTDNDKGKATAESIKRIGFNVNLVSRSKLKKENIKIDEINIFVFDFIKLELSKIFSMISQDTRLNDLLKYIILDKKKIKKAADSAVNFMHTEFLPRPIDENVFILLLEKSVIVERYKEVMSFVAKEADERIKVYENLIDINRKDVFDGNEGAGDFKNILNYEKNLLKKQTELTNSIHKFTVRRLQEMFYDNSKLKPEEILEKLKAQELTDKDII